MGEHVGLGFDPTAVGLWFLVGLGVLLVLFAVVAPTVYALMAGKLRKADRAASERVVAKLLERWSP